MCCSAAVGAAVERIVRRLLQPGSRAHAGAAARDAGIEQFVQRRIVRRRLRPVRLGSASVWPGLSAFSAGFWPWAPNIRKKAAEGRVARKLCPNPSEASAPIKPAFADRLGQQALKNCVDGSGRYEASGSLPDYLCALRSLARSDACRAGADARASADSVGTVSSVKAPATVTRGGNANAQPLKVGDDIFQNDELSTGLGGALGVTFDDETTFTLQANASIKVDDFVYSARAAAATKRGLGGARHRGVFRQPGRQDRRHEDQHADRDARHPRHIGRDRRAGRLASRRAGAGEALSGCRRQRRAHRGLRPRQHAAARRADAARDRLRHRARGRRASPRSRSRSRRSRPHSIAASCSACSRSSAASASNCSISASCAFRELQQRLNLQHIQPLLNNPMQLPQQQLDSGSCSAAALPRPANPERAGRLAASLPRMPSIPNIGR